MREECKGQGCQVTIEFGYDKFQKEGMEVKIIERVEGLDLRIKIKDEYSIKVKQIEEIIEEVLSN